MKELIKEFHNPNGIDVRKVKIAQTEEEELNELSNLQQVLLNKEEGYGFIAYAMTFCFNYHVSASEQLNLMREKFKTVKIDNPKLYQKISKKIDKLKRNNSNGIEYNKYLKYTLYSMGDDIDINFITTSNIKSMKYLFLDMFLDMFEIKKYKHIDNPYLNKQ